MHSHILNIRVYTIYLYINSDINKRVHIKKQQKYKYPFTLAIPANMWPKQSESKNHIKQKKKNLTCIHEPQQNTRHNQHKKQNRK